jgi:DNA processing protein
MSACDACLRRTDLVAATAARLDVEWRRRSAPAGVLSLPDEVLLALDGSGRTARRYEAFAAEVARAEAARAGLELVCRCDGAYPDRLGELSDPPAMLHVAGGVGALTADDAVAIVGARRGTPYGLEVARGLGRGVASAGLSVVSGLALGVDSAAHIGALEHAAAPVAVLAGGADVPYPASRRGL